LLKKKIKMAILHVAWICNQRGDKMEVSTDDRPMIEGGRKVSYLGRLLFTLAKER